MSEAHENSHTQTSPSVKLAFGGLLGLGMRAYVHAWETLFEKPQRDTLIGALIDTHGFLSQPGSRCIHTLTQRMLSLRHTLCGQCL